MQRALVPGWFEQGQPIVIWNPTVSSSSITHFGARDELYLCFQFIYGLFKFMYSNFGLAFG